VRDVFIDIELEKVFITDISSRNPKCYE